MSPLTIFPDTTLIAPPTFCGSVDYYAVIASYGKVIIDTTIPFSRNNHESRRCDILTANGVGQLTIPTCKIVTTEKSQLLDVEIDYSRNWQHVHWGTIFSAYGRSPYFEYYADLFNDTLLTAYMKLVDYDIALDRIIREIIGIDTPVIVKKQKDTKEAELNRDTVKMKRNMQLPEISYYQVWRKKFNFVPHLSILDLIFNLGKEAALVLKRMNETAVNS